MDPMTVRFCEVCAILALLCVIVAGLAFIGWMIDPGPKTGPGSQAQSNHDMMYFNLIAISIATAIAFSGLVLITKYCL